MTELCIMLIMLFLSKIFNMLSLLPQTQMYLYHPVEPCYGHLQTFGKVVLSEHVICQAEEFLLECVSNDKAEPFNNLKIYRLSQAIFRS